MIDVATRNGVFGPGGYGGGVFDGSEMGFGEAPEAGESTEAEAAPVLVDDAVLVPPTVEEMSTAQKLGTIGVVAALALGAVYYFRKR